MVTKLNRYFIDNPAVTIVITSIISTFLLFSLDKDMHSFSDLFKMWNLIAAVFYIIPAVTFSSILYTLFRRIYSESKSLWAMALGIPGGFAIVMSILSA
jgi:hypothetical protein